MRGAEGEGAGHPLPLPFPLFFHVLYLPMLSPPFPSPPPLPTSPTHLPTCSHEGAGQEGPGGGGTRAVQRTGQAARAVHGPRLRQARRVPPAVRRAGGLAVGSWWLGAGGGCVPPAVTSCWWATSSRLVDGWGLAAEGRSGSVGGRPVQPLRALPSDRTPVQDINEHVDSVCVKGGGSRGGRGGPRPPSQLKPTADFTCPATNTTFPATKQIFPLLAAGRKPAEPAPAKP